ncbi:MAG: hypothetical protein ACQEQC_08365 [Elusimicrobiota bacterium]
MALVVSLFITPGLRLIWYPFRFIKVFWHEIGHTALGWLFGYFTIPAVNPLDTGGVAMKLSYNSAFPYFIIVILIIGTYLIRNYDYGYSIGGGVTIGYGLLAFTPGKEWLITGGGILAEYIMVGVCLYFCLFRINFKVKGERFLYGVLGWFVLRERLNFLFRLKSDEGFYDNYVNSSGWQKGIIGDLAKIAFDVNYKFTVDSFNTIVNIFIILAFIPVIILGWMVLRETEVI